MNRCTSYGVDWVEALESRQMFSAAPHGLVIESSSAHLPKITAEKVRTPSIVGIYSGTVNDSNEQAIGVITAVIKTQNAHGKITGYVESAYPGHGGHKTNFTGTISGDAFIMTTPTTTVTGTVSNSGTVLTGSYSFNSSGDSSIGQFVVTRSTRNK